MEKECKLIFKDDSIAPYVFRALLEIDSLRGYRFRQIRKFLIKDTYFDSSDFLLEKNSTVCRFRQFDRNGFLEIKKAEKREKINILYQKDTHPLDSPEPGINFIRNKIGRYLKSNSIGQINPILKVKIHRSEITVEPIHGGSQFLIHLDEVEYRTPENDEFIEKHFEIELKEPSDGVNVDVFREILRNSFGLIPIRRSKLARCSRVFQVPIPRKVIMDMDPGVDDALAILLAMNSPELQLLAVTITGGNVELNNTTRNTCIIFDFLYRQGYINKDTIPILARGYMCERLKRDASNVHGPDGLGGVSMEWGDTAVALSEKSIFTVFNEVTDKFPNEINLIATGPLTNIARFIARCPSAMRKLKEIVVMGGVFFESGNRTQAAEFNIHADPISAAEVLKFTRQHSIPLIFVGLDVTHKVYLKKETIDLLAEKGNKTAIFVQKIIKNYMDFHKITHGLNCCHLHDPLAVGYVIDPTICEVEKYHVEIEARGEHTIGMSVADLRATRIPTDDEVTGVCIKVDSKRFEQMFVNRVFRLCDLH